MYKSLVDLTNDGILVFDEQYRIEFANRMASTITGYANEYLLNSDITKLLGPTLHVLISDIASHPERYGEKTCTEMQLTTAQGELKDVEICIAQAIIADGLKKIYAYIRDITDQRKSERELKNSNEFFANLIASSVDGIIAADMKGNVIIFNAGAEALTDYTADEVISKINITKLYPEGVAKEVMKKLRSPAYGGVGKLVPSQLKLKNKSSLEIPCQLSAALIYDSSGKEMASVGIFTDLRPQLLMEKKLRETHLQLASSEKLASLGKLAAGIAHEINNPLGGILIYASLMMESLPEDNAKRQDLARIVKEAGRCKEIVKSLLEFARQSGPRMEPVDINGAITDGLFFLENQAIFHNIKIIKNLDSSIPYARGNSSQLKQVFMNVIINAAEAMHGSGTLTISTFFNVDKKKITIEFTDTGEGIPEENITRIFDPFFTTKDVGKGTGLGLSTAYGIIEGHEGRINVKSKPGEGATFSIELAVYRERRPGAESGPEFYEEVMDKYEFPVEKRCGCVSGILP